MASTPALDYELHEEKIYSCVYPLKCMKKYILVILLVALCINQAEPEEVQKEIEEEEQSPPPEDRQLLDSTNKTAIEAYFSALNQRDFNSLQSLTHPYYAQDVQPLLDFVIQNDLSFTVNSVDPLMDEEGFRGEMSYLSDEEFSNQVGKRGLSYEVVLTVTKGDVSYEDFIVFVYIGETEEGWKVLDPYMLQLLIEAELEVKESKG